MLSKKYFFLILFFSPLVFIFSCDSKRIFEENKSLKENSWDYNVPVVFTVTVNDTSAFHNMYLNVRNGGFYRFSNLFLFVNTRLPKGELLRDTVELTLASPEGKWLGGGLGDIYDNRLLFRKHFRFPQAGEYRFELIQAMRVNPLPGIMDAGIRIEKE
jgi:gliding motility-associated lipoprotein GldH